MDCLMRVGPVRSVVFFYLRGYEQRDLKAASLNFL
jgi:hypothetical protein